MTKEDIQNRAEILIEEVSTSYSKLTVTMTEAMEGGQSIEYLDAIYSVLREDVKELRELYKEYSKLKEEDE